MRIKRLCLTAFGPFLDKTLEFTPDALQIIYGANEAGKSSALRGLKALLFGIPERTPDNFRHPNEGLFIAGELVTEGGDILVFSRRKKRKGDLLDAAGNPLDKDALLPFLHGIDPALFGSLYGIDHEVLVQGGQEILEQKGELGQALFTAGTGVSSLQRILAGLEQEADELFKPRGSKQAINQALAEYVTFQRELRESSLSGREWKTHKKELEEAALRLGEVERCRDEKAARLRHLERINKANPLLAQRLAIMARLEDLGPVTVLPADFAERRRMIEKEMHAAQERKNAAFMRCEALKDDRKLFSVPQPVLDQADTISALHQQLGKHRKGKEDQYKLNGMRIGYRTAAGDLLRLYWPDRDIERAEGLKSGLGARKLIQGLAAKYEVLAQQRSQAEKKRRQLTQELEKIEGKLFQTPPPPDYQDLSHSLARARKAGDLDDELRTRARELENVRDILGKDLLKIGLWRGGLEEIFDLPLPLQETVARFSEELRELDDGLRELVKEREKNSRALSETSTRIRELNGGGEIPTEEELTRIRAERERGWQLLRRQWLAAENVEDESSTYDPVFSLPDAYEKRVARADTIADRLRREADRVLGYARLKAEGQRFGAELDALAQREQDLLRQRSAKEEQWRGIWRPCSITPRSPREMISWWNHFDNIRFRAGERRRAENELQARIETRQVLREGLLEQLRRVGGGKDFGDGLLSPVLYHAETALTRFKDVEARRSQLLEKKNDFGRDLDAALLDLGVATDEMVRWQKEWGEAARALGLGREISPAEAGDILEALQGCFTNLKEAETLQKRIDGIERDAGIFMKEAETIIALVAPDLAGLPLEQAVVALHGRLTQAKENQAILKQNDEELRKAGEEGRNAEAILLALEERLAELVRIAACAGSEELDGAQQRSNEYLAQKKRLTEVEETLLLIAEGVSLTDLEQQAATVDPDELPAGIEALRREITIELDPRIKTISVEIGERRHALQRMDGSAKAAETAEKIQQVQARIRRLAGRYVRLKLAAKALRDEIERFRAENQDPVLRLASQCFKHLTLGSFICLQSDTDDDGRPVIIGRRPDNARVPVSGMSSGTRDQLYLALRLASIESRLTAKEPMPFIVDDILINFDDARSRATLEILADLAAKNQIILFTHHQRVVEEAKNLQGRVSIHEL